MKQENNEEIERIRYSYEDHEPTKTQTLRKLDAQAKRPADIFAYSFGTASALVLGTGMCLAMQVIGTGTALMATGIVVGVLGIAMATANYFIYKAILKKRKRKYADRILELSDEILNA